MDNILIESNGELSENSISIEANIEGTGNGEEEIENQNEIDNSSIGGKLESDEEIKATNTDDENDCKSLDEFNNSDISNVSLKLLYDISTFSFYYYLNFF